MSRRGRAHSLSDIECLRMFDEEVERLGRRRLVVEGIDNRFTVSWNRMEGLRMSVTDHDEEDLRAFLTDYRRLHLRRLAGVPEPHLQHLRADDHERRLREHLVVAA